MKMKICLKISQTRVQASSNFKFLLALLLINTLSCEYDLTESEIVKYTWTALLLLYKMWRRDMLFQSLSSLLISSFCQSKLICLTCLLSILMIAWSLRALISDFQMLTSQFNLQIISVNSWSQTTSSIESLMISVSLLITRMCFLKNFSVYLHQSHYLCLLHSKSVHQKCLLLTHSLIIQTCTFWILLRIHFLLLSHSLLLSYKLSIAQAAI